MFLVIEERIYPVNPSYDRCPILLVIGYREELHAQSRQYVVGVSDILFSTDHSKVLVSQIEIQLLPVGRYVEVTFQELVLHHACNEVHHSPFQQAAGDG